MRWDDFMDRYSDWSESTLRSRIAFAEDFRHSLLGDRLFESVFPKKKN